MDRNEIKEQCLQCIDKNPRVLLELPTGIGKSCLSIQMLNHLQEKLNKPLDILLLVAKRVHKQNWQAEFDKWHLNKDITVHMDCYESLKKHQNGKYDCIVLDEFHHIGSDMRLDFLSTIYSDYMIGLSATISRDLKKYFTYHYHVEIVSATLQEAISEEILPEPEIILLPLTLDNIEETEIIEVNPKARGEIFSGHYKDYWKYKLMKVHAKLHVTKKQYLRWLNGEANFYKDTFMRTHNAAIKMKWLKVCSDRLKFLAECKTPIVAQILKKKKNCRTLTFCNNINQAEELGTHSIHSKNVNAEKILNDFNKGKINHITAVQMLNEGMNLKDCQYCIFANLNASERVSIQRTGRALRHKHPKILIPYYKDSREEEIMKNMVEGYDPKLLHVFPNIKELL